MAIFFLFSEEVKSRKKEKGDQVKVVKTPCMKGSQLGSSFSFTECCLPAQLVPATCFFHQHVACSMVCNGHTARCTAAPPRRSQCWALRCLHTSLLSSHSPQDPPTRLESGVPRSTPGCHSQSTSHFNNFALFMRGLGSRTEKHLPNLSSLGCSGTGSALARPGGLRLTV